MADENGIMRGGLKIFMSRKPSRKPFIFTRPKKVTGPLPIVNFDEILNIIRGYVRTITQKEGKSAAEADAAAAAAVTPVRIPVYLAYMLQGIVTQIVGQIRYRPSAAAVRAARFDRVVEEIHENHGKRNELQILARQQRALIAAGEPIGDETSKEELRRLQKEMYIQHIISKIIKTSIPSRTHYDNTASYTRWLNSVFLLPMKLKWRPMLEKKSATSQCNEALGAGWKTQACYICTRPAAEVMHCEHLLSIVSAVAFWGLINRKFEGHEAPQHALFSRIYAPAHECCNLIKSNYDFILFNGHRYTLNDDLINTLLDEIRDSNEYDCSGLSPKDFKGAGFASIRGRFDPILAQMNTNLGLFAGNSAPYEIMNLVGKIKILWAIDPEQLDAAIDFGLKLNNKSKKRVLGFSIKRDRNARLMTKQADLEEAVKAWIKQLIKIKTTQPIAGKGVLRRSYREGRTTFGIATWDNIVQDKITTLPNTKEGDEIREYFRRIFNKHRGGMLSRLSRAAAKAAPMLSPLAGRLGGPFSQSRMPSPAARALNFESLLSPRKHNYVGKTKEEEEEAAEEEEEAAEEEEEDMSRIHLEKALLEKSNEELKEIFLSETTNPMTLLLDTPGVFERVVKSYEKIHDAAIQKTFFPPKLIKGKEKAFLQEYKKLEITLAGTNDYLDDILDPPVEKKHEGGATKKIHRRKGGNRISTRRRTRGASG